ncbi:MAG: hypothetical protein A2169_03305 [Deltaproteobacteria bacterium RBG_13_47_9]|nr:MAG: hypothetical protein A2169_03305 [Deltaproteobacteria bacterium RBG_13_47_9]
MRRWGYYDYFRPSIPRAVKGGIKAQSKRGGFGESWWARRWIAVLESFNIGARLGRGRSYARNGQVLSIEIGKGEVKAKVQGSRPKPYDIKIHIKTLSAADWRKLAEALSHQAIFLAKLLAGQMPEDIEGGFKGVGLSLFPERLKDLKTDCSCPDWSNPCKHIAAVYYLLGEEFDRDPFVIFKLRGMSRDEFVQLLDKTGDKRAPRGAKHKPCLSHEEGGKALLSEPLTSDVSKFWSGGSVSDDLLGEVLIPLVPAALLKRLGNFPFWRGEERFLDAIEPIYVQASPLGMNVFLGDKGSFSAC